MDLSKVKTKWPGFVEECDITRAFIGFGEALEAGHAPDSPECMKWINWLAKQRGELTTKESQC